MKELYNGEALNYLKESEAELIGREVVNAHLGLMGAEEVTTYRCKNGLIMHMKISNGGCTLEILSDEI